MANQKISELTAIATIDNATDVLPIVDTSATTTKKITLTQVKTSLALNNVDNTSDANKPVSSAQQTALDAKQATLVSGTNIKTINGSTVLGSGNISISSAVAWGGITGTLSTQTDLQTALDLKVDENAAITGATKTKITYDAKGLVTAGADATTADIADSTNRRYVTDAQSTVIGNTSGTNTGDNATNSQYSGLAASKQDTLVSATNIKTINSTSLLGSGNIAISTSPSGVAGAIQFSDGTAFSSDATTFFWDNTNKRLGIGTNSPASPLSIVNTIALSAGATNPRIENIAYTINNTGAQTGTATGIFLNATETNLNGQTHNLMDLQRGGGSNFKIGTFHNAGFRFNVGGGSNYRQLMTFSRIGDATSSLFFIGAGAGPTGTSSYLAANNDDMYFGTDISGSFTTNIILPASGVGRILLGGLTSSFPSIKRNGTAIDFRLADDSALCAVNTGVLSIQNTVASAVAVASTHKVTISIGGTTYYLLATNV